MEFFDLIREHLTTSGIEVEINYDEHIAPALERLLRLAHTPPPIQAAILYAARASWDRWLDEHTSDVGPVDIRFETGDGHGK